MPSEREFLADVARTQRFILHVLEGMAGNMSEVTQALADLDAEISAVGSQLQALQSTIASGNTAQAQADASAIEQRVAALKGLLPAATPPAAPADQPPAAPADQAPAPAAPADQPAPVVPDAAPAPDASAPAPSDATAPAAATDPNAPAQ